METPEFPPPALAEVRADGDRAQAMARLQQLHDESQALLARWATRTLPDHELSVRADGRHASVELRRLARFATQLSKVVDRELDEYDEQQAATLAAVLDGTAGGTS